MPLLPPSFFKFVSRDGARSLLGKGTLKWSRRSEFNDPYDMQIGYSTAVDAAAVRDRALDLLWHRLGHPGQPAVNAVASLVEELRPVYLKLGEAKFRDQMCESLDFSLQKLPTHMAKFGVEIVGNLETLKAICFCEENHHVLMWSHYADSHQGLCLEFVNVPSLDSVYRLAQPVIYGDEPPPLLETEELAQLFAGNRKLGATDAESLMRFKAKAWEYEQEWRIISGEGRYPDQAFELVPFGRAELAGIYFGSKGQALRDELLPLIAERYPAAKLYQGRLGKSFRTEFDPL